MNNINDIILNNFNANIAYIERFHPKLFEKLSALDTAVANGHYQERYELVYEGEGFDVLERATGTYLYNKKINSHAKLSAQTLDRKLDNNTFECFFPQHFTQEMLDELQKIQEQDTLKAHKSFTAPIIFKTQNHTTDTLKKVEKFIFFGVGLGEHLFEIDSTIKAENYLIVEDDLELFRLSLFVQDYSALAKRATLFFAVFEDDNEFSHTVNDFLQKQFYQNHYIKYFQLLSHSEEKANRFYLSLINQGDLQFYFNDYMLISTRPLEFFASHYKVLQRSLSLQNSPLFEKPFLLCASGPSLQHNIEWLQNNAKNFIIVAVSSALQYLEKFDIKPQIVVHLDPFDASWKSFERLSSLSFIDDALIFAAASSPKIILEKLPKEHIYLFEASTTYQRDSLQLSAPCVGSLAYQLLLVLKAQHIYLLGLDFAVDQETLKDHAGEHQDTRELQRDNTLETQDVLDAKEGLIEIDGNMRDKVLSTPSFFASVDTINRYFHQLTHSFQKIYNLSDGAKLSAAKPQKTQNISHLSPISSHEISELHTFVEEHTQTKLTRDDINKLLAKHKHAQKLLKRLRNFQPKKELHKYAADITTLLLPSDEITKYELSRVIESYLYYILHFIHFRLTQTDATHNDAQKLHTLLSKQLTILITYYIDTIEKIRE